MWDKFYIVTIDVGGMMDSFNYKSFHEKLIGAKGVNAWWHYLESTYILKVEYGITAHNIGEYIQKIAPNKRFFVCELNLGDHNGWLPQEAWEWIRDNNNPGLY